MPETALCTRRERKVVLSELRLKIEEVLAEHDFDGARALLPDLRILRDKLRKLRACGLELAEAGLSKYVVAVATLAGRGDEFAEFA